MFAGYINDGGSLNMANFEMYLRAISQVNAIINTHAVYYGLTHYFRSLTMFYVFSVICSLTSTTIVSCLMT